LKYRNSGRSAPPGPPWSHSSTGAPASAPRTSRYSLAPSTSRYSERRIESPPLDARYIPAAPAASNSAHVRIVHPNQLDLRRRCRPSVHPPFLLLRFVSVTATVSSLHNHHYLCFSTAAAREYKRWFQKRCWLANVSTATCLKDMEGRSSLSPDQARRS